MLYRCGVQAEADGCAGAPVGHTWVDVRGICGGGKYMGVFVPAGISVVYGVS